MPVVNPAADVPVVTALPGAPVDGQEIDYLADATNGIRWRLRYRAASSSAYKWEFVGGAQLVAFVDTSEQRAASGTAYAALTTAGPAVTVPLAGDYVVDVGADVTVGANGFAYISYNVGATGAIDADAAIAAQTAAPAAEPVTASVIKRRRKTGLAAATALVAQYRTTANAAATFGDRWLAVKPVRVG